MALLPHQIDDLVRTILAETKRHKWTDISIQFPFYIASELITEKRVVEQGGPMIQFLVKVRKTGLARNTGLFGQDVTGVENLLLTGSVRWSQQTTNFSYDVDEPLFQTERLTIVNQIQVREMDALADMAELNEENLWSSPVDDNDIRPNGIPYWIVKAATPTEGGYVGGAPTGHTTVGGIDPAQYPRWRNWAFTYQSVSVDDLIRKIKRALAYTQFRSPIPNASVELKFNGRENDYTIFTTYDVVEACERLAESRNENLGADLARYVGMVVVAGVPMRWVPYLQASDSTSPVYGINWNTFRPFVHAGCNMRRSEPKISATQHTVRTVFYDNRMNYVCVNRRGNFVGHKVSS